MQCIPKRPSSGPEYIDYRSAYLNFLFGLVGSSRNAASAFANGASILSLARSPE